MVKDTNLKDIPKLNFLTFLALKITFRGVDSWGALVFTSASRVSTLSISCLKRGEGGGRKLVVGRTDGVLCIVGISGRAEHK